MGRYMSVVLKDEFKNDRFIADLNRQLSAKFGSNVGEKFLTWQFLQEEADYLNTHSEGLLEMPDWKRPITKEQLSRNFFWFRHGEFGFKLSGGGTSDEARDAVAVCKWIQHTNGRYIDRKQSDNYKPAIVREYLDHIFWEDGYDLKVLWERVNIQGDDLTLF
jgi:hypothetical protein